MASMVWLLHSVYSIVMGRERKDTTKMEGNPNEEPVQEGVKGLEFTNIEPLSGAEKTSDSGRIMNCSGPGWFQMPLHYPRYGKADYQKMEEWKVDVLLQDYGLSCKGSLDQKRAYAMGAFLWPHQRC